MTPRRPPNRSARTRTITLTDADWDKLARVAGRSRRSEAIAAWIRSLPEAEGERGNERL